MAADETTFYIEAARAYIGTLARTNLFMFEIGQVPGGLGQPEDVLFFAETAVIPGTTTEEITVPWMNSNYKYVGPTTYGQFDIQFRVNEDYTTLDMIQAWHSFVYDPTTGIVGLPSDYQCDGLVSVLTFQGEVARQYQFIGMFPTNVPDINLAREGGGNMVMPVTFSYQYWLPV